LFNSSSCLPPKSPRTRVWNPVTLPPDRARVSTRPRLTGSATLTKTIGIVDVASLAARVERGADVTMTSTFRRGAARDLIGLGSISDYPAGLDVKAVTTHGGQPVGSSELDDALDVDREKRLTGDDERASTISARGGDRLLQLIGICNAQWQYRDAQRLGR